MKSLSRIRRSRALPEARIERDGPRSKFPCPQTSVGRFISTIGNQTCWEAIGPARSAFVTLAPKIKNHLDTYSEPTPAWVTWSIYMVGQSQATATPTIVFCCESEAYRKAIRNMVRESGILNGYPGIALKHLPRAPDYNQLVQLASEPEQDEDRYEYSGAYRGSRSAVFSTVCRPSVGSTLFIRNGTSSNPFRKATSGGIIRIHGTDYVMTAGHAFVDLPVVSLKCEDEASEMQFSDSEDGSDTVSHVSDTSTTSTLDTNYEIDLSGLESCFDPYSNANQDQSFDGQRSLADLGSQALHDLFNIGELAFSSLEGPFPGLDFALVELHESPSTVPSGPTHLPQCIKPDELDEEEDTIMMMHTASAGALQGFVASTPRFMRTPNTDRYQEVYNIVLEQPLSNGDCGSWVHDARSGKLFGHVIAGSPNTGLACVVPAYQVFEVIQRLGPLANSQTEPHVDLPEVSQLATTDGTTAHDVCEYQDQLVGNVKTPILQDLNAGASIMPTKPSTTDLEEHDDTESEPDSEFAAELTSAFEARLKKNHLLSIKAYRTALHGSPVSAQLVPYRHALPLIPTPPTTGSSKRFRNVLNSLSEIPCKWEDPGLLDEALRHVPLERIYNEADEESSILQAEAASLTSGTKAAWGYQDCVVRALLRWFRRSFFQWVNNPLCESCNGLTIAVGMTAPLPVEEANGASQVEAYQCSNGECAAMTRFPRYQNAFVLLQTRRGRVGEWSQAFGMLCRAVGSRVRWVWCAEDHVWVEIYSVHRQRWVHVDPCEEAWDKPLLYTDGWNKSFSYCIAFSIDGAADVTGRYVRRTERALPRKKTSEAELLHTLEEIRSLRQEKLKTQDRLRLKTEHEHEVDELRKYAITALVKDFNTHWNVQSQRGTGAIRGDAETGKGLERRMAAEDGERLDIERG
ncbi:Protein png1 [Neodidymelliopsis sp. IMI 364377]|nr:Protein png1 [Neodidymelliopsis sp. IMI 364377]